MNLHSITNQLLFSTVRIRSLSDGRTDVSTAFILNVLQGESIIPVLVTCAHSVLGDLELQFLKDNTGTPRLGSSQIVKIPATYNGIEKNKDLDICVIALGPIFNHYAAANEALFFRAVGTDLFLSDDETDQMNALENVTFVGYPKGLADEYNCLPLFRRGITASPLWADYENKPWFIIDSEVFAGSSGSPVFILDEGSYPTPNGVTIGSRLKFVGMIIKSFDDIATRQHIGLGVVLKAKAIRIFLSIAVERIQQKFATAPKTV